MTGTYLRLAVALGERDPDALDYYYGPADLVADVKAKPPTLREIQSSAAALLETTAQDPFLFAQLQAIVARAQFLQGTRHTFDQEAREFFGFEPMAVETASFDPVRAQVARLLPGSGSVADRLARFERGFMIPPERVPAVMTRALEACRQQTAEHIKLPAGEHVSLEYVSEKPWSAYSYYHGNYQSVIRINTDFGLTIDRALQLACHEGYPGHHVFNALTEEYLVRGKHRLELQAQPTFSPQSFTSEAAATVAPDIAFPPAERVRVEREVLAPLAGGSLRHDSADLEKLVRIESLVDSLGPEQYAIARDYVDGSLEFVRAADALEARALMAHADATIRYLNEYRSYVVTYTAGHEAMKKRLAGGWTALENLIRSQ